jgi:pilus assembly protein FimV
VAPAEKEAKAELAMSEPEVDFALDLGGDTPAAQVGEADDSAATATIVNPLGDDAAMATMLNPLEDHESTTTMLNPLAMQPADLEFDDPALAATSVNPGGVDDSLEFDVKLTDSVFLGQPMTPPDFDIGSINLDLSAEPEAAASAAVEEAGADEPATAVAGGAHDAAWEEANTKLDLAKAYEEMGDLEGARELLQEVIGEGPGDLVEQARAVLGRIGE